MSLSSHDIARKTGLSVATVSRVLNNSPLVKKETRDRVQEVIQKFNYRPNLTARGLAKGISNLLTVVVPSVSTFFSAFYYKQVFCGISDYLSTKRYRLMIYQPEGYDPQEGYPQNLDGLQTDGLFIVAPLLKDRLVKFLEAKERPAVLINARSKVLDWVDLDNIKSSILVMEKLVGSGHRRIAFIQGTPNGYNSVSRLQGYRLVLSKFRIPYEPDLVGAGYFDVEGGYESAKKFLALARPPTAIFAANDLMAQGAIRAITETGRSVPEDISVFGFDDSDVAPTCRPPLSTVKQPFYEMGKIAAETLISRVEYPELSQKCIELSGELVLRESSAELNR